MALDISFCVKTTKGLADKIDHEARLVGLSSAAFIRRIVANVVGSTDAADARRSPRPREFYEPSSPEIDMREAVCALGAATQILVETKALLEAFKLPRPGAMESAIAEARDAARNVTGAVERLHSERP